MGSTAFCYTIDSVITVMCLELEQYNDVLEH